MEELTAKTLNVPSEIENGGYDFAHRLTGLKFGTLYAKVSRHQIPHIRISPRLVLFNRTTLMAWLDSHRVDVNSSTTERKQS